MKSIFVLLPFFIFYFCKFGKFCEFGKWLVVTGWLRFVLLWEGRSCLVRFPNSQPTELENLTRSCQASPRESPRQPLWCASAKKKLNNKHRKKEWKEGSCEAPPLQWSTSGKKKHRKTKRRRVVVVPIFNNSETVMGFRKKHRKKEKTGGRGSCHQQRESMKASNAAICCCLVWPAF